MFRVVCSLLSGRPIRIDDIRPFPTTTDYQEEVQVCAKGCRLHRTCVHRWQHRGVLDSLGPLPPFKNMKGRRTAGVSRTSWSSCCCTPNMHANLHRVGRGLSRSHPLDPLSIVTCSLPLCADGCHGSRSGVPATCRQAHQRNAGEVCGWCTLWGRLAQAPRSEAGGERERIVVSNHEHAMLYSIPRKQRCNDYDSYRTFPHPPSPVLVIFLPHVPATSFC